MRASQTKMSSSEMGPAVMPSGGEEAKVLYSWNRRREAMLEAIFFFFLGEGRRGRGVELRVQRLA